MADHSPNRRTILAGGIAASGALAAAPAFAQSGPDVVRVAMKTGKGLITLELYAARAPITVKNFLRYVDARRLDGSTFYRASHVPNKPEDELVEGGLKGDPKKVFKPIAHESTLKTGLKHMDGAISMARRGPGTATADFFIVIGAQEGFDASLAPDGDKDGFAAFGQVIQGMDVVRTIFESKVSATAGIGAMRGEMLSPPTPIVSVRRTA